MRHQPTQACTPRPGQRVDGLAALLAVDSVGSLVPRAAFEANVHSVFEHACNLQTEGLLLTVCTPDRSRGPATLRLAPGSPGASVLDLRRLFSPGEAVRSSGGTLRSRRVGLSLARAQTWIAPPPRCLLDSRSRATNLRIARARLARFRASRAGARSHVAAAAALGEACRRADLGRVRHHAQRLVGLGEGLTPSGDDFLAGLLAGVDATATRDGPRGVLRHALAEVILEGLGRTTAIAANGLRLAVQGHHDEPLCALREALLCQTGEPRLDAALAALLAVGATSGADMADGLLAGIESAGP